MIKQRKPRGIKLNGKPSLDMCPHCKAFFCDPSSMSTAYQDKQMRRYIQGVCSSCGSNPCTCKSSLNAGTRYNCPTCNSKKTELKDSYSLFCHDCKTMHKGSLKSFQNSQVEWKKSWQANVGRN